MTGEMRLVSADRNSDEMHAIIIRSACRYGMSDLRSKVFSFDNEKRQQNETHYRNTKNPENLIKIDA